jgi:DNA-directed RNA polymerase subunit K/omega
MSEHHELIQTPPVESPAVESFSEAQPIESRFLFVDVSAMRAKQLRRGAKVRLDEAHPRAIKPERVAMDEVRHHLVEWHLPDFNAVIDPK